jgi:hypothetical protein
LRDFEHSPKHLPLPAEMFLVLRTSVVQPHLPYQSRVAHALGEQVQLAVSFGHEFGMKAHCRMNISTLIRSPFRHISK